MHPTFHYELATARIADLHRHAAQERTVKAARRAREDQRHRPRDASGHAVPVLGRWLLTLASGHRTAPAR